MILKRRDRIGWIAPMPSGDQIDFLRALAQRPEIDLSVIYCSPQSVKGALAVSEPFGRGFALGGVTVPGPGGPLFLNSGIIPHLMKTRYDLVIVSGYIYPTMQLAMMMRALQQRPWVLFAERPGVNNRTAWGKSLRMLPMLMPRTADAVISTGRLAQQEYQNYLGENANVFCLPYLVDLDPFLKIERAPRKDEDGLRLLSCGQLVARKGIDVLISAFVRVTGRCPNVSLEIVGDGPEKSNLMQSVPGEFKSSVVFTGNVPFEQRAESFGKADVFVHPARHDGWGVVIQEAMASGLPVISTRETGAAYDLVDEGQNGFLVGAGDVDGLADSIAGLVKNRDKVSRLGMNARRKVSGFTPEWGAERFVQISRSILDARWEEAVKIAPRSV